MVELEREERVGLSQEIRESTDSREEEQNTQRPRDLFLEHSACWLCCSRWGFSLEELSIFLTPSPFSCIFLPCPPIPTHTHTHKGSLILLTLYSKACTWPCTQSWTWLLRAMTLVTCLLFPSSLPHSTLFLGEAFVQHLLFKRINCQLPVPVSFFQGSSCK